MGESLEAKIGSVNQSASAPQVSVITPVFNGQDYLVETINSIREQAGISFEHILIDDGSTDNSGRLLDELASQYPDEQVRVVHQTNSGEATAVNTGWKMVRGKYVVVVNADDPLYPDALQKLAESLDRSPQAVVAYPDWAMIDGHGNIIQIKRTHEYSQQGLVADFLCIPGPGAMIRRSAVRSLNLRDPKYRYVSDYDLWLRLSLEGEMIRVPEVLARWRLHSTSATSTGRGNALTQEMLRVVDDFVSAPSTPNHIKSWRRQSRAMSQYYAGIQKLYDPAVAGRRLILRSLFTPFRRKATYSTERRDVRVAIAILTVPLSTTIHRLLKRSR